MMDKQISIILSCKVIYDTQVLTTSKSTLNKAIFKPRSKIYKYNNILSYYLTDDVYTTQNKLY